MRKINVLSMLDVTVTDERYDDEVFFRGRIVVLWMERDNQMGNDYQYDNRDTYKQQMGHALKKAANLIEQSDY